MNEKDISAETIQGGLVFVWRNTCQKHEAKNQHVLKALRRKALSLEEALENVKSFFAIRKYSLDHCGECSLSGSRDCRKFFQLQGRNIEKPYRHHSSWPHTIDSIITNGLVASQHMKLGYSLHTKAPGVYTSRSLTTSGGYARPPNFFGDYAL